MCFLYWHLSLVIFLMVKRRVAVKGFSITVTIGWMTRLPPTPMDCLFVLRKSGIAMMKSRFMVSIGALRTNSPECLQMTLQRCGLQHYMRFGGPEQGGGTGIMFRLEERVHFRMEVGATIAIKDDASPMCRKELLMVISCLVKEWRGYFVICAWLYWEEDRKWRSGTTGSQHSLSSSHLHDDDVT